MTGDPGHVPARPAAAVDGKERKLAKAGGKKKVHLLAAVTHVPGLVIAQDRVAKAGKANEVTHFRPLLEPLPLDGVLVTADAMQTTRDNALFLRKAKNAHYLWPVLGNQPGLNAQLNALPWETAPVTAATSEISHSPGNPAQCQRRRLPCPRASGTPSPAGRRASRPAGAPELVNCRPGRSGVGSACSGIAVRQRRCRRWRGERTLTMRAAVPAVPADRLMPSRDPRWPPGEPMPAAGLSCWPARRPRRGPR